MKPSELIKQVLADPSGQLKDELITEFAEKAEEIWHALNQGVNPDEYERLIKITRSIETSVEVIETLWRRSVH